MTLYNNLISVVQLSMNIFQQKTFVDGVHQCQ